MHCRLGDGPYGPMGPILGFQGVALDTTAENLSWTSERALVQKKTPGSGSKFAGAVEISLIMRIFS